MNRTISVNYIEHGKIFLKSQGVTDFVILDRSDNQIKENEFIGTLLRGTPPAKAMNAMKTGEIAISFLHYRHNKSTFIVRQKRVESEFSFDSPLSRPFFQTKIALLDNIEVQGFISNGAGFFSSLIAQFTQKSTKEFNSDVALKDYFTHGESIPLEIDFVSVLPIKKSNKINILDWLIRISDHFDLIKNENMGFSNSTSFIINTPRPETTDETFGIIDLLQFYLLPFTNKLFSFVINFETEFEKPIDKPNLLWLKQ